MHVTQERIVAGGADRARPPPRLVAPKVSLSLPSNAP
jgi:hypothetical protein